MDILTLHEVFALWQDTNLRMHFVRYLDEMYESVYSVDGMFHGYKAKA